MSSYCIRTNSVNERKSERSTKTKSTPPPQEGGVVHPRRRCGRHYKKQAKEDITMAYKQSETTNRSKEQEKTEAQQKASSRQPQQFCGTSVTSSMDRLYLLSIVGLVPCFPVCRLLPAFVNRARPPGTGCARQHQHKQNRRVIMHPRNEDLFHTLVY